MSETEIDYVLTGHRPFVPPIINPAAPRLPSAVIDRLRTAYVPDVCDAVGPLYTMNSTIRPLYSPTPRLLGQALTVKAVPGDNLTVHGALGMVAPGDVLVIDWRGYVDGCATGSGSVAGAMSRGLVGAVVDGAWRDIGELQSFQFPVFGRAIAPLSPPKNHPGEINVPVHCGGVIVSPGDVIIGDAEGVAVVPHRYAEAVTASLREYTPRGSVEEWEPELFDERARRRNDYFARVVRAYGGDPTP